MRKPITNEQLEEHAKRHEEVLKEKMDHREQERFEKLKDIDLDMGKYKTKIGEDVSLWDARDKEEKEYKEEMKRLNNEKKETYARYVREMHQPHQSEKKQMELQIQVGKLKHPVREKVFIPRSAGIPRSVEFPTRALKQQENRKTFNSDTDGKNMRPL
jgi:hypothetical protein